jgi:hypothetical protein
MSGHIAGEVQSCELPSPICELREPGYKSALNQAHMFKTLAGLLDV